MGLLGFLGRRGFNLRGLWTASSQTSSSSSFANLSFSIFIFVSGFMYSRRTCAKLQVSKSSLSGSGSSANRSL
jgi:hypothetical protein